MAKTPPKAQEPESRAPMDDHQFAMVAREHLGAGTNAEAYDALLAVTDRESKQRAKDEGRAETGDGATNGGE